MAARKQVIIYGKAYNLKSPAFSIDPEEVAAYLDSRMRELSGARGKSSAGDIAVLAALNIAQELLELKKRKKEADQEAEAKLDSLIRRMSEEVDNINSSGNGAAS